MTSPLVTVGVPVHNGERYLRAALESVLAQDHEDFELLLCDNASTDGTASICAEYASRDARVRYFGTEENRGAAWNYNRIVDEARGRYLRWMPHDDLLDPNVLGRCLAAFRDGPEDLVLAYPRTVVIDADGELVEEYEDRAECLSPRPHERVGHLLRHLVLCNPVLGLVRLDVLRQTRLIGVWPGSDVTLLLELALRGRILEVRDARFLRRRAAVLTSPSNMTPEDRARWFDERALGAGTPRLTLCRENLRAVGRAPLSAGDRARCRAAVARDFVRQRRRILGEVRGVVRRAFARRRRGSRGQGSSGTSQ